MIYFNPQSVQVGLETVEGQFMERITQDGDYLGFVEDFTRHNKTVIHDPIQKCGKCDGYGVQGNKNTGWRNPFYFFHAATACAGGWGVRT